MTKHTLKPNAIKDKSRVVAIPKTIQTSTTTMWPIGKWGDCSSVRKANRFGEESEGEKGRQAVAGGMQKRYTWTICQSIWEPNSYIENLTANAGIPER